MNEQILMKAHNKFTELYSDEPDVRLLNRFYDEKRILENCNFYLQNLELVAKIRREAERRGEYISLKGAECSLFIAYLLGTTDINPLPMHEYCPKCKRVAFLHREGSAFDKYYSKCNCGEDMVLDGYDIPFEPNLKKILLGNIKVYVSDSFFKDAKKIIDDEMGDREAGTPNLNNISQIQIESRDSLDKYRELENATGVKAKDIIHKTTEWIYSFFKNENFDGIPEFDTKFMKELMDQIGPKNISDLLKLIGFAHSTNVWKDNADVLYNSRKMSLSNIPACYEDIYLEIVKKLRDQGVYSTGLACEVTGKTRKGYYALYGTMDEETCISLINLGFDMDFILFIEKINYMVSKTYVVATLRESLLLMYYKTNFETEFNNIMYLLSHLIVLNNNANKTVK